MKVRASALYIVIVIALVIAVICSSLIVVAYYYRIAHQQARRFDRLRTNLGSGENILLADSSTYAQETAFDLFDDKEDSISLHRYPWGIYDVGVVKAFASQDTVYSTFKIGSSLDTAIAPVLYLPDEDRPLSVSGKTSIEGIAYIPKAGARTAYVNNIGYNGDKRIIEGKTKESQRTLPALDQKRLSILNNLLTDPPQLGVVRSLADSIRQLFRNSEKRIQLPHAPFYITNKIIGGHVILVSDTSITIDGSSRLQDVIVVSKTVKVGDGFNGTCQIFATDSLMVGENVHLSYPSCLGLLSTKSTKSQQLLKIGKESMIDGVIFTEPRPTEQLPVSLQLANKVTVNGEIYSGGTLVLTDGVKINGSTYASRFLYQTNYTAYENYLINVSMRSHRRSKYYLSGMLLPYSKGPGNVLQWLKD